MTTRRRCLPALPLYLAAVIVSGVSVLVVNLRATPLHELAGPHPWVFLTFAALLVATEARPLPFLSDGGEVTASWTFAFAMLFVAPPAGCLAVVVASSLLIDTIRAKQVIRSAFNACQFALSLAVGSWVGYLITDLALTRGQSPSVLWLAAAAAASATAFCLNAVFIGIVLALHAGLPVMEALRRSFFVNAGMDGVLLALAPIFARTGVNAWVLLPLLLITVWIILRSASIALSNRHEATHDLLTGIPNRRMFEDHAALLLDGTARAGCRAGLIHLDLDGFKGINDRLGHYYGDQVLKQVARRLHDGRRAVDHVSRLGGDEFAVLLGRIDTADDALDIARRLLAALQEPMDIEGVPLSVSASLGVSIYPDHGEDLTTLMQRADMATYEAKASAANVVLWRPETGLNGPGKLTLLADLSGAVDHHQLQLVFQPKANVTTGAITGVEALVRWLHPSHGLIPPGRFMPQAEQTELIAKITDLVLDQAITQCVAWHAMGIRVAVAVNASARNLHDLRFPARVQDVLERHHLDPAWLELEITENTVMADPIRTASVLGHLRALGVRLSVDDFGTGYSSLANLRTLTIDAMKIDRSFVTEMTSRPGDLAIARSVVELGHNLGVKVVAEGVETAEVLRLVSHLGCDEFQGYLLSRPKSAAEIEPLLRAGTCDLLALATSLDTTPQIDLERA
jgi:diguanylate cyclase (GGDEF)-like protein